MNVKLLQFFFDLHYYDEKDIHNLSKFITEKTEYYQSYLSIIKKTVNLMEKLKIFNPLEIKIMFEYLLYNGYLSNNKNFIRTTDNRINNIIIEGADIMRGTGVCLNISELLKRIYENFGYESYVITSLLNKASNNRIYIPNIAQKTGNVENIKPSSHFISNLIIKQTVGNHAINLVNDGKKSYICDATNLDFINPLSKMKGKFLFRENNIKLLPNFEGLIGNNLERILELINNWRKI